MASTDARPVPQKNVAYRVTFPIFDADGDPVTGASGLDSEVSKDGGTFADCTNEATEIATSSGVYYLDLTSTEMNADTVAICVKTSTSGAKTTVIVLYPEETGDIRVNATAMGGTILTARDIGASVLLSSGTGTGQLDFTSGVVKANVTQFGGSAGTFGSGRPEVNTTHAAGTAWGSGAITAASIAAAALNGKGDWNVGKTGYTLSQAFPTNFSSLAITAGGLVDITQAAADKAWGTASRVLTAGTNIQLPANGLANVTAWTVAITGDITGNLSGSVGSVTTKTGYSLADGSIASATFAANALDAVWSTASRTLSAFSFTVTLATSQPNYAPAKAGDAMTLTSGERTAVANTVEAEIIDDTDSEKVLTAITDKIASVNPSLGGLTLSAIAAAVRDVSNASPPVGSLGAAVKAVADRTPGSGTLAVSTDVPSAATNASAVRSELATELARIDAATTTRSSASVAPSWYTAPVDVSANVTAIKAKTDNIPSSPAAVGSAMTLADGAITDAKFATPTEASGQPTGVLGWIRRIFERMARKRSRNRTTGACALRNAADDGDLETWTQSTSGSTDTFSARS